MRPLHPSSAPRPPSRCRPPVALRATAQLDCWATASRHRRIGLVRCCSTRVQVKAAQLVCAVMGIKAAALHRSAVHASTGRRARARSSQQFECSYGHGEARPASHCHTQACQLATPKHTQAATPKPKCLQPCLLACGHRPVPACTMLASTAPSALMARARAAGVMPARTPPPCRLSWAGGTRLRVRATWPACSAGGLMGQCAGGRGVEVQAALS
jgi:hypothetical protein